MIPDNVKPEIEYDLEQEILYKAIEEEIENDSNDNSEDKEEKLESKINKTLKSGLQIKTVVLLLLTLLVNTYAWFIYLSTVETKIEMHINEWEFELEDGDAQGFLFTVEEIYPGMQEAKKEIIAKNKDGSMDADLSCEIVRLKVLDTEYVRGQEKDDGTTYTSDELLSKMLNDYPFKIQIFINDKEYTGSQDNLTMVGGEDTTIKLTVNWPYETGNVVDGVADGDAEDTKWGSLAYNYLVNSATPEKYSIQVELAIKAVQHDGAPANP